MRSGLDWAGLGYGLDWDGLGWAGLGFGLSWAMGWAMGWAVGWAGLGYGPSEVGVSCERH